jgi:hypothetical protein
MFTNRLRRQCVPVGVAIATACAGETVASISVGVGSVTALHADCTVDPNDGTTRANGSVASASLLGGLISITDIHASCVAGAGGVSGSSSVGTINGIPIGTGSGSLAIPGVATVFYNETRRCFLARARPRSPGGDGLRSS